MQCCDAHHRESRTLAGSNLAWSVCEELQNDSRGRGIQEPPLTGQSFAAGGGTLDPSGAHRAKQGRTVTEMVRQDGEAVCSESACDSSGCVLCCF